MALFESAKYKVLNKETRNIELREYAGFFMAESSGKVDSRFENGFSDVFNYISGQNATSTKISMTTPVVSTVQEESLKTGFVVPSKFGDKAPLPTNKKINITEVKAGMFLVIRFSGSWTQSNFDKHDEILKEYIHTNGYQITSVRYILRYQPPMIPSFLRRNEIMYRVEKLPQVNTALKQ